MIDGGFFEYTSRSPKKQRTMKGKSLARALGPTEKKNLQKGPPHGGDRGQPIIKAAKTIHFQYQPGAGKDGKIKNPPKNTIGGARRKKQRNGPCGKRKEGKSRVVPCGKSKGRWEKRQKKGKKNRDSNVESSKIGRKMQGTLQDAVDPAERRSTEGKQKTKKRNEQKAPT